MLTNTQKHFAKFLKLSAIWSNLFFLSHGKKRIFYQWFQSHSRRVAINDGENLKKWFRLEIRRKYFRRSNIHTQKNSLSSFIAACHTKSLPFIRKVTQFLIIKINTNQRSLLLVIRIFYVNFSFVSFLNPKICNEIVKCFEIKHLTQRHLKYTPAFKVNRKNTIRW